MLGLTNRNTIKVVAFSLCFKSYFFSAIHSVSEPEMYIFEILVSLTLIQLTYFLQGFLIAKEHTKKDLTD